MVRSPDVPKSDPREVAAQVQAAVLKGGTEVLADDVSRHRRAGALRPRRNAVRGSDGARGAVHHRLPGVDGAVDRQPVPGVQAGRPGGVLRAHSEADGVAAPGREGREGVREQETSRPAAASRGKDPDAAYPPHGRKPSSASTATASASCSPCSVKAPSRNPGHRGRRAGRMTPSTRNPTAAPRRKPVRPPRAPPAVSSLRHVPPVPRQTGDTASGGGGLCAAPTAPRGRMDST